MALRRALLSVLRCGQIVIAAFPQEPRCPDCGSAYDPGCGTCGRRLEQAIAANVADLDG